MPQQRVLITGASGLLGRAVLQQLQQDPASWHCLGLCHSRAKPGLVACDLTSATEPERLLRDWRPEFVIHCAAERRPDVVSQQPEATQRLNVASTQQLAQLCHELGAKLLYISTDYVFDGESPPYDELSPVSPLNAYGRSKADGEAATLRWPGHCVLRVPILYGDVEFAGESAVTQLLQPLLAKSQPCSVDDFASRFPTHCADVALVIADLLKQPAASISGVYHWSGEERFTKFGMLQVMAEQLQLDAGHVSPQAEPPAAAATQRPKDSQLSCQRILQLGICHRRPFAPAIGECLRKFV